MEDNKYKTTIKNYTFKYDGNNMVDVYRSWDESEEGESQSITCFSIGKVSNQKKFEMEVGFWAMENSFF